MVSDVNLHPYTPDMRPLASEELPSFPEEYGVRATGGWRFGSPVVEMPRYLAYLHGLCESLGGTFHARRLQSLAEAGGGVKLHPGLKAPPPGFKL